MEDDKQRAVYLMLELGCWHDFSGLTVVVCLHCGMPYMGERHARNPDLTTWEGFGLMWQAAQKMEWWVGFLEDKIIWHVNGRDDKTEHRVTHLVNPIRFMLALYDFGVETGRITSA